MTMKRAFEQERHYSLASAQYCHEKCHIDSYKYIPRCTFPEIYRWLTIATRGLFWRPTTHMAPDSPPLG